MLLDSIMKPYGSTKPLFRSSEEKKAQKRASKL